MDKKKIEAAAMSVRALSADSINRAGSGHPGLPLGSADIGAVLFGEVMNIHPVQTQWINRDRFVLSAGHGSMLLYSLLHLSGYDLSLEDLKNFRQAGSKTPGHPEYGHTPGVEATTGPLGAGISNAVGMAIGETILAEKFNSETHSVIDHYTYALAGDGCLMEGVALEAASLAGHLGLGKLIVLYDSNNITIEGSTQGSVSDDIQEKFSSMGWQTLKGDGHNVETIRDLIALAHDDKERPTLIELKTTIGFGSPNRAGTSGIHGTPLGEEETRAMREALGIPVDQDFYINPLAEELFTERRTQWDRNYKEWEELFKAWAEENSDKKALWDEFFSDPDVEKLNFQGFTPGDSVATRKAGGKILSYLSSVVPSLTGGSADLNPSTNTYMEGAGDYSFLDKGGRNLHFGIREHAMGGAINGLALYGGFRSFCSTFLVFSDYMKPAVRLAALMNIPSTFIFTHDSFFVGEDGPTHQPVEHVESLRSIPGLLVLRPADAEECFEAWKKILAHKGPSALILSRQDLTIFQKENWQEDYHRGAYIAKDSKGTPEAVILTTGSEVNMALEAAKESGKNIRVVSVASRELFISQDVSFRERMLPPGVRVITAEAGIPGAWHRFTQNPEDVMAIETFGLSGKPGDVAMGLGFTKEALIEIINREGA